MRNVAAEAFTRADEMLKLSKTLLLIRLRLIRLQV